MRVVPVELTENEPPEPTPNAPPFIVKEPFALIVVWLEARVVLVPIPERIM